MPNKTAIEWTTYSSNPVYATNRETGKRGHMCVHASPGCENCYAEQWNGWRGNGLEFRAQDLGRAEFHLNEQELRSWLRLPAGSRCFVGDMTDLFGEWVPDEWLDRIFAAMALAPGVTFQLLTKRADRLRAYVAGVRTKARGYAHGECGFLAHVAAESGLATKETIHRQYDEAVRRFKPHITLPPTTLGTAMCCNPGWPLPNVWLGVSAEDQRRADERIPLLLQTPAAVRFVSAEPLLGPINLSRYLVRWCGQCGGFQVPWREGAHDGALGPRLDWVIAGSESGCGARRWEPEWFNSLQGQCGAAGVAFFLKQVSTPAGKKIPLPELNGRQWAEFPEAPHA